MLAPAPHGDHRRRGWVKPGLRHTGVDGDGEPGSAVRRSRLRANRLLAEGTGPQVCPTRKCQREVLTLALVDDEEQPHALYRYRGEGKGQPPLYIGRSNNPMRRAEEHRASKTWITEAVCIDLECYPADAIAEAERQAIRREHPIYNIQHNNGRLRLEVSAEVTLSRPSPESIVAMCAMVVAGGMAAVWAFDSLANWNVKRRAERAGQPVEVPPARNLFAQDPKHWSAKLLESVLEAARPTTGELKARELRRQGAMSRLGGPGAASEE